MSATRREGGDALPLEPSKLVSLRTYISLWERGLGHHDTFVEHAVVALLAPGITDKALQLLAPFPELHDDLALRLCAALAAPLATKKAPPPNAATGAALRAWLAARLV